MPDYTCNPPDFLPPKYKKLDDYDYYERKTSNTIHITAEIEGLVGRLGYTGQFSCSGFKYSCTKNKEADFCAIQVEDGGENQFVKNQLREELLCVVVNAEQNLNYQLSYSSKYSLLSKVTKAFHDKLTDDDKRVDKLKELFQNIQNTFLEVKEFETFNSNMSAIAGQMLSNMSHALQFDFSAYDPSNYFKTLRVQPTENGKTRAMEELGTGQQQILALSFAHAYAKSFLGQGLIFILDEPEAHLHPLAQKWLAKQMFQMAKDGLQIVITSHSPHFINLEFLENIYLVKKYTSTTVCNVSANTLTEYCKKTGAAKADENTIIPFYASHSKTHILNGFFANKIILVEGETEELVLSVYLDTMGLDTLREGIAIIGVGGKGNLAKWWRLFTSFKIPTFVCFDNDTSDDGSGIKRKDALKAIGIVDNLENLLTIEDWNVSSKYCVFGLDFENTMRNSFKNYTTYEAEEKVHLGDSKPIIAKAVAERLQPDYLFDEDEGWKKFLELKQAILELR